MKNSDLDLKTRMVLKLFGLKRIDKKDYNSENIDDKSVYVFDNYNEFKNFLFANGVIAIDTEAVSLAILHIEKNGKIVALKKDCDEFIKMSKGIYKVKSFGIK